VDSCEVIEVIGDAVTALWRAPMAALSDDADTDVRNADVGVRITDILVRMPDADPV
jgi:hypothetical protein